MNRDEWDLEGIAPEEQDLARLLAERAGLMREIEHAAEEIDPSYARTLRAHLLYGDELAPHPTFARRLRVRLTRRTGDRRIRRPGRRLLPWICALLLSVAAVVATLLNLPSGSTFHAPYPSKADLLFNLPSPATLIRRLTPTASLLHPVIPAPYGGKVTLQARHLPAAPKSAMAYRLAGSSDVAARGRRILSIRAPVRRVVVGQAVWLVAADGGTEHKPLHSLAVSPASGELIYHDRRNSLLPRSRHAAPPAIAVSAARRWLSQLGWPGAAMAVRSVTPAPRLPRVRQVVFGWSRVGSSSIEEATLWVTPDRSIIEAWVWPPVAQSGTISPRSVLAAWSDIMRGRAPLIIRGVRRGTRTAARATLTRVSTTIVLVRDHHGDTYLVPAYLFQGTAVIGSGGPAKAWLSLVPGAIR